MAPGLDHPQNKSSAYFEDGTFHVKNKGYGDAFQVAVVTPTKKIIHSAGTYEGASDARADNTGAAAMVRRTWGSGSGGNTHSRGTNDKISSYNNGPPPANQRGAETATKAHHKDSKMVQVAVVGKKHTVVRNKAGPEASGLQVGGNMTEEELQRLMSSLTGKNSSG